MALIRQLQAQDAAQFGGLGFGMLNLGGVGAGGGGLRRRAPAAAAAGMEGDEKSAQEAATQPAVAGGGGHELRGMIGRSLFHFNSRSIASWLPSFSFEVVRSIADDPPPPPATVPPVHPSLPQPPPHHPLPPDERKEEPSSLSASASRAAPARAEERSLSGEPELMDDEKGSSAPLAVSVSSSTLPAAAPGFVRSTSERSRREMILEATQRRLQQATHPHSSTSSSSASSSSPVSPTPPSAPLSPSHPSSPSDAATGEGAALRVHGEEENEDATYDDINCGRDGQESEWSDEDAIVQRITAALESKEREVEAHTDARHGFHYPPRS